MDSILYLDSKAGPSMRGCARVYIDDLIVYSPSVEEHYAHLQLLFSKLREAKVMAKLSKL